MQQSSGSTGCNSQMWEPAAAPESDAANTGDEELAGLLTAWYNAGYETGRQYEKSRLQKHVQNNVVVPQTVH